MLSSFGNATLRSAMTVLPAERRLETLEDVFELATDKVKVRAVGGSGAFDM